MKSLRVFLSLAFALVAAARAEADLASALRKRGVVAFEETEYAARTGDLSWSALREKLKAAEGTPLELYLGRTVLVNGEAGLKGLLNGVRGVKEALTEQVAPEEGSSSSALVVRPLEDGEYPTWRPYFDLSGERRGSRDIALALTLRRHARILKLFAFLEDRLGAPADRLTDEAVARLATDETYRWLADDVFEPVTVLFDAEFQRRRGQDGDQPGPAFSSRSTLDLLTPAQVNARRVKDVDGCVVDGEGRFVVRRTDSVVLVGDAPGLLTVDGSIASDVLGSMVGHELFHGIMADMMGRKAPGSRFSVSRAGHDAPVISDYSLAFSEGWAEYFEALAGAQNPAYDGAAPPAVGGPAAGGRFLVGRQIPVRRNLYTQEQFEKWRATRATGDIKNGSQMMATEGLVAGVLYRLLTHDDLPAALDLATTTMYRKHPRTFVDLVKGMAELAPDGRARDVILTTFLRETMFATVSGEARALYETAYRARLAFFAAKNAGRDPGECEDLHRKEQADREAYESFVERLRAEVLAGRMPLDGAVGPELWLDAEVEVAGVPFPVRYNLNTATPVELLRLGLEQETVEAVVSARDAAGAFASEEDLHRVVGRRDRKKLRAWREAYEESGDAQLLKLDLGD